MKKAFTLVEVIIVVAIVGLIVAIAIPSFVKARNLALKNAGLLEEVDTSVSANGMMKILAQDQVKGSYESPDWGSAWLNATTLRHYGHYYVIFNESAIHAPWCPCGGIPNFALEDLMSAGDQPEPVAATVEESSTEEW